MPFSGPVSDLSIDLSPGSYDDVTTQTQHQGRIVLTLTKPTAVHSLQVEFHGEETVNLRAWVPLSTTTATTPIVGSQTYLYNGGTLPAGVHIFTFTLVLPSTLPPTLSRELCTIKYKLRTMLQGRAMFFGTPTGTMASKEEEVVVVGRRQGKAFAQKKTVDQSVGCPDGTCHVRFLGNMTKDVVRPGGKVRITVCARTSSARFGVRLLAVNFAECVECHVQVRGEERLTKQITNLVGARLDALDEPQSPPGTAADDGSGRMDEGGAAVVTRTVRKTRSRLADLLKNPSPTSPSMPTPPVANNAPSSPVPPVPQSLPRVVRQVRASHTLEIPLGLSQFDAEYISRSYRIMLVAEVAPMEESEESEESVHINEPRADASYSYSCSSPRSTFDSTRRSSSSTTDQHGGNGRARRKWTVSEQSSAMTNWPIDVVDSFAVVDTDLSSKSHANVEVIAGEHKVLDANNQQPQQLVQQQQAGVQHHHRRTNSGIVGFLKRGFRGSPSPRPESEPSGSSRSLTPVGNAEVPFAEHMQQFPGIRAAVAATRSMRSSSAPHHPPPSSAIFSHSNASSKDC